MVGCLGTVFYLAEAFVYVCSGLADGLGEQLRVHEVGAGAGGEIAAVLYQLHAAQVDLTVALDSVFDRTAGFGEGRWIQNNHIKLFALLFQLRKQIKDICALEGDTVRQAV